MVGGAFGVVVLVVGLLWALQRRLIYRPDPTTPPQVLPGARDVVLRTDDGLELSAWYVPASGADLGVAVLVAPGNGGNRAGRAPLAARLSATGLAVLLVDYRGYGGNPGRPSQQGLARDIRAAHRYLTEQAGVPSHRQLYFGESLGAAVATELATEHPPGGLLLRSPFTDLASVAQQHYPMLPARLLLRDRYPVAEQIRGVRVPTVVVYGTADSVVSPVQSQAVAAASPRLLRAVRVAGVDHNDPVLLDGDELISSVGELVAQLSR
ncbi:MAG: alpha/beta hydrolase [Pseudonocardiaceae bacterium]